MADRNSSPALARTQALAPGRLSTLALVGGAAGAVPLPLLSWAVLRRVKGAVAHDIATRHGLSLTPEARDALATPFGGKRPTALLSTLVYVARRTLRRLGPLGVVPPMSAWLEVYALGLLFDRYLLRYRESNAVRIEVVEAMRLREAIERALGGTLSLKTHPMPGAKSSDPIEDARDATTRLFDGLLLGLAAVPHSAQRRLEAAFDEATRTMSGFRHG